MSNQEKAPADKIERCGFCGQFFIADRYMTAEELNATDQQTLEAAPLGYCPNAGYEDSENEQRYVTRDMAIDAGDLSLEGQRI